MNNRTPLLLSVVLLCASPASRAHDDVLRPCVKMERPADHAEFIAHLGRADIKHEVDDAGWVLCRSADHERVGELGNHVLGVEGKLDVQGIPVPSEKSDGTAAALVRARIGFQYRPGEDGKTTSFKWSRHDNKRAQVIVDEKVW